MGAIANMTQESNVYSDGMDSVVIRRVGACLIAGKTLDMTDFPDDFVKAGHIVIRVTSDDTYKPLGVSDGAYSSLPAGSEYVGVVRASKPKSAPFVSIMYTGEVNDNASPYPLTEEIKTALKAALPGLYFKHD